MDVPRPLAAVAYVSPLGHGRHSKRGFRGAKNCEIAELQVRSKTETPDHH